MNSIEQMHRLKIGQLPVIIELHGRQPGLDNQILIPGEHVKVYDRRAEICFLDYAGLGSSFVDKFNPRKPYNDAFMEEYIISAYFDKGIFTYDTMAGTDSDAQYVGVEIPRERLDEIVSRVSGLGGKSIRFGRRVSEEKMLQYIEKLRDRSISEQTKGFYQLNRTRQKVVLKELLRPHWKQRLKE